MSCLEDSFVMTSLVKGNVFLLLDASSPIVQVGLLQGEEWLAFRELEEEAIDSIFAGTSACLEEVNMLLKEVDGFLFCEGPGSILGIRLAAMAINGWRSRPEHRQSPVFSFRSLEVAVALFKHKDESIPFHIVSEYRRDRWHLISVNEDGQCMDLTLVAAAALSELQGSVYCLPRRKNGPAPPAFIQARDYSLRELPLVLNSANLLRHTDKPEAYLPEKPVYVKWDTKRHH